VPLSRASKGGFSAAGIKEKGGLVCLRRGVVCTVSEVLDVSCSVVGEGGRRGTIALGS
jgi:hypothetical protein